MIKKRFAIVSPCFNEEEVICKFLTELEEYLSESKFQFTVIIANDGSTDNTLNALSSFSFNKPNLFLHVINLKYNVGHQEAIRQGLIYTNELRTPLNGIFVMDSDGEDNPKAIVESTHFNDFDVIFFERGKRKESFKFKIGYGLYKLLFAILVGKKLSFGNYSLISQNVLSKICNQYFFHYAGFLSKQKYRIQKIQYDRRARIDGHTKMNINNLVIHGLKGLIEYSEEILIFFIKSLVVLIFVIFCFGSIVIYKKLVSHQAILGWASSIGVSLVSILVTISAFIVAALLILSIKNILNQMNRNEIDVLNHQHLPKE